MKKATALLMALLLALCLSAPLYALAEDSAPLSDNSVPVVTVEAEEAPLIATVEGGDAEADPGGIDLTPLLQALIGLLATWVTVRLVPWIKSKTTERQYEMLLYLVSIGAKAAENLFPSGTGPQKFAYVVEYLRRKGLNVDEAEIESVVYDYFTRLKEAKANE